MKPQPPANATAIPALLAAAMILASAHPAGAAGEARDYPMQPVPFTKVRIQDGFWTPRMETNRITTIWYDFKTQSSHRIS